MGKNFSGNTNKRRSKSDFYQTPYNITRRLLEVEKFSGRILVRAKTKSGARGNYEATAQKSSFALSRGGNIAKSQRKRASCAKRQDDDEQRPQATRHNKPYRQPVKGKI